MAVPGSQDPSPTIGSRFTFNNTSYSGADIKIVVNIYNTDGYSDRVARDLQEELGRDQDELILVNREISNLEGKLDNAKPGSHEWIIYAGFFNELTARKGELENTITEMQQTVARLNKNVGTKTSTKVLAEAQTLSVSTFRDKQAVRACGSVYPKGFCRGPREVAGTIVFTVFDEHVLYRFLEAHASDFDASSGLSSALLDQLPPVDITVVFANEYGFISRMGIFGVEFIDEGQVMSIEDIITENVVSFVARDIDPMREVGQRRRDEVSNTLTHELAKRASDLLLEDDYQAFKSKLSPYGRFSQRRNPWI